VLNEDFNRQAGERSIDGIVDIGAERQHHLFNDTGGLKLVSVVAQSRQIILAGDSTGIERSG
jgi:hypothetical protein